MRLLAAILIAAAAGLPLASRAQGDAAPAEPAKKAAPDLNSIIPSGSFKAELMRLAFDKSAEEISKRFNEALSKDPAWLQDYMAQNAGVKPLPYHPKFGISEEDYKRMLKSFERKTIEPVAVVEMTVAPMPDGSISLECPQMGTAFAGLSIETASGKLRTPYLEIEAPVARDSKIEKDPSNPFGDWTGLSWKGTSRSKDGGDFKSISLIAGKLDSGDACFIAYRVKAMEGGKISRNSEAVFRFKPPRPSTPAPGK